MRNSFRIIMLAIAVMIIGVSATVSYYFLTQVVEIKTMPYDFNTTDQMIAGYNLDTDMVHFGVIPLGYQARRYFEITNTHDFPVLVRLEARGDGEEFFAFTDNKFTMQPGENRTINVFVIPDSIGHFEGEIIAKIAKK